MRPPPRVYAAEYPDELRQPAPVHARRAVHRKADRRAVHPGGGRLAGFCPLYRATCGARLAWQARSVKVVFSAELWLWDARRTETWTFVSLPAGESEEIRDLAGGLRRGFGSVRVRATIGKQHVDDVHLPG